MATLNLAAREINDEANYTRILRTDFFDVTPDRTFCRIPEGTGQQNVLLPPLDAVVGNPPYVRQEKIEKPHKERYSTIGASAWPDLKLSGRSDLHCYFWPAATRLLKADGLFGFLTSSSWLDVEYGFELQGWILRHFRILAILESAAEPWFEDARVKTCITILQRCEDETARMANKVRFVRFNRELTDIIGVPPGKDEVLRQMALDAIRERILGMNENCQGDDYRIIIKDQRELWEDGMGASPIFLRGSNIISSEDADEAESFPEKPKRKPESPAVPVVRGDMQGTYCAGK